MAQQLDLPGLCCPQPLPPAERLIDAALKALGPNGERWIQREVRNRSGRCIIGALDYAARKQKVPRRIAYPFILRAIKQTRHYCFYIDPRPTEAIPAYNDLSKTTYEMVREVMLLAKCEALRDARLKSEHRELALA